MKFLSIMIFFSLFLNEVNAYEATSIDDHILNKTIIGNKKTELTYNKIKSSAFSPYMKKNKEKLLAQVHEIIRKLFHDPLTIIRDEDNRLILQKLDYEHSINPLYIGLVDIHSPIYGRGEGSGKITFKMLLRGHHNTNSKRYLNISLDEKSIKTHNSIIRAQIDFKESGSFIYNNSSSHRYRAIINGETSLEIFN